jgi:hypothetical protein
MKKYSLILVAILFMFFSACGVQKVFHRKSKPSSSVKSPNHLSYVKMHRTACFGRCPIYYIEIFDDGLLRYNGIRFVNDTGLFEKRIDASRVRSLIADFEKNRIDTLQENYANRIVDLPGIIFVFNIGNDEKQINNAQFGPNFLRRIATEIDNFITIENGNIGDKTWKKIK